MLVEEMEQGILLVLAENDRYMYLNIIIEAVEAKLECSIVSNRIINPRIKDLIDKGFVLARYETAAELEKRGKSSDSKVLLFKISEEGLQELFRLKDEHGELPR